jgi:membrane-bound inhibitor of C-type lysozyme
MRGAFVLIVFGLAGCSQVTPPIPRQSYACEDGRVVLARYPDTQTAVLEILGVSHTLKIARSGSGARYVGDGLQWWTNGLSEAPLASLAAGEDIVPPGVRCVAAAV